MPKQYISAAATAAAGESRLTQPKKLSAVLAFVAEWLVLISAIAVPIFYLPWTSESLELPKQVALLALVSLAFLAWIGSMLANRTIALRRTVANPIAAAFLAAILISALASSARFVGLVGGNGQEYQSLLTSALFIALLLLVTNIPDRRPLARRAMMAIMLAGGVASFLAVLQFAGVKITPFASSASFNVAGSVVVLGFVSAIVAVISASSFVLEYKGRLAALYRSVAGACGIFALSVAFIIDFWPVWTAIIAGLLIILACALVRPQAIRRLSWLAVPMGVILLSSLMLFVNPRLPITAPVEVFPSFSQSLNVARSALFAHPILGSGPGTYAQAFAKFRGVELNTSALWYLSFDRGLSYPLTTAATTGLAGLVALLALVLIGAWKALANLLDVRKKDDNAWVFKLAITAAWAASAVGIVIYGASMTSLFLFWFLLALLVRETAPALVEVKFEASPRAALGLTFGFVIVVVLSVSAWFVNGSRLYSDVVFAQSMGYESPKEIDRIVKGLEKSLTAQPRNEIAARSLAQAYALKIQKALSDQALDQDTRLAEIQAAASSAIKAGQLATTLGPENDLNWSQLGSVYESLIPYVTNASDEAIKAYEKAAELNPTSPVYPTAAARSYVAVASKASLEQQSAKDESVKAAAQQKFSENLAKAENQIKKALELKSDYAAASYQLALVKDLQGKIKEAISQLQAVELTNPTDIGVAFKLAVLYYRDGQKDQAAAELVRSIKIEPKYADARWLLVTIYEEQKKWDEAIAQAQEILKTNPDNEMVKTKILMLEDEKAGKINPAGGEGTPSSIDEGSSGR